MPDATCPPPPLLTTKRKVRAGWSLLAAGALILGSVYSTATPAEAAPGDASATGASVHLGLELGGETVIDETLVLAQATAPSEGGTADDSFIPLVIDEEQFELRAEIITAEATREADASSARAEVADVLLRLADQELVAAQLLTADVACPADGPNTADAQTLGLQLGGQSIADVDLPAAVDIPLDVALLPDDVVEASARVQLRQVEETSAEGARATALIANVRVIATLADNEVIDLEVGDVILADARCESPDGDGTDADGLPGIGDDDADGPSADSLSPDSGPTAGGTEVTVDGSELDRTETVTVDGTEVEFEVNEDGTQLTFVTPPGEAGTVDVVLTYDDDSSDTLEFTYTDEGTAVLGESEDDGATDADGTTDGTTDAGDATALDGAAASGLPVTGAQSGPASLALALLLLTGGAWLLAWRERAIPIVD